MIQVLLIDDDQELCNLQRDYLTSEGFAVTVCHNGEQGLETALRGEFDILLLDQMLPGLSGSELLRRLRQHSALPVLMITAEAKKENIIAAAQAGASGYIVKPFTAATLSEKLEKIFEKMGKKAA